jgi:transcriptional regulator with XRE-family HTH domain
LLKCHFTLLAKKPTSRAYPVSLTTLGDHIRKKRLDLGLFQKDVAAAIGVDNGTITNWEKWRSEPELRFIPKIIEFLGYRPDGTKPVSLGETIRHYRQMRGISQKELARELGIDPSTLAKYEVDKNKRCTALGGLLKRLVDGKSSNIA